MRETYTEEESDKETTQKQKATQNQKEEDEEAWVGEEFIRSRKRASLCPIGALE